MLYTIEKPFRDARRSRRPASRVSAHLVFELQHIGAAGVAAGAGLVPGRVASRLIPRPSSAHGEERRGWTLAIQVAQPAQHLDIALQIRLRTGGACLVLVQCKPV